MLVQNKKQDDNRCCHNAKKMLHLFVIVLLFFTGATACQATSTSIPQSDQAGDKLAEIMKRGTLIIATDANFPPASKLKEDVTRLFDTQCAADQYTGNQLEGFDVDVAKEIAKRLGLEACFVTPTWTLITSGSWADRWDISVGSMTITEGRMEKLYFTQPYYSVPAAFFVHKDTSSFSQPQDLSGRRIGAAAGETHERYLQRKLSIPGVEIEFVVENPTIVSYQAGTDAMRVLAQGGNDQLDAVLVGISAAYKAIENGEPLKQLGDSVFDQYAAVAIDKHHSKDPKSLVIKISKVIGEMHTDGILTKSSEKYHVTDLSKAAGTFDWQSLNQFPEN